MNDTGTVVVVLSTSGDILAVTRTNEKGYKKSIENGELWHLVPETGRLLPFEIGEDFEFKGIGKRKSWIEAIYSPVGVLKEKKSASRDNFSPDRLDGDISGVEVVAKLTRIVRERKQGKEGSYTSYLFKEGSDKIRKKLGEEAVELILARKREEIIYESADLFYHLLVLLESEDIDISEIFFELKSRMEE